MESVLGWGSPIGLAILIVSVGLFILLVSLASMYNKRRKDK